MVLLASNYDQSRFLKAADLSTEKKFRIKSVTEETVGTGKDKETKLCIWFSNDKRGMVMNKTNIRTLRGPFGDNCESWIGKVIVIYPTMSDFRGTMTPCLRVRVPAPKEGNGQVDAANPAPPPPPVVPPAATDVDPDLDDEIVIR
jgi:hypothetical protein